jgi:hypothetical protein
MALIKLNNQSLTAVSALPAGLDTGKVLQVVQTTGTTTAQPSTNETWVDCTASITITPSSASSKILLMHSAGGLVNNVGDASLRILRNTTVLIESDRWGYRDGTTYAPINWSNSYLDSPSTTSAVTYKWQIRKEGGTSSGLRHTDAATAVSIAMEIAG